MDSVLRISDLRQMLMQRRCELHDQVNVWGDVDATLLQMRADALRRIDDALSRLDAGTYGWCFACGRAIAEERLRGLPFAARCGACDERHEHAGYGASQRALRGGVHALRI